MTKWQSFTSEQASAIVKDAQRSLRDRQQALWRLCRIAGEATDSGKGTAAAALVEALKSNEPSLRQIAAHSLSVQRIHSAASSVQSALELEKDPAAARAMSEALGRLGTDESLPVLLGKLKMAEGDRMLEHSLIYALIEIGASQSLMARIESPDKQVARAAMLAVDQIGEADAAFSQSVWKAFFSDDKALVQSAADILARHKEWPVTMP